MELGDACVPQERVPSQHVGYPQQPQPARQPWLSWSRAPGPADGAILGGRRAQAALRGCSSTGHGIQLCLSQHEDVHLGSWYPQKRLLWVSQGQMQSHSTGGTGQTTTAGPSDEEGDNGPSGAARHLSRPSLPALDASTFAGCCCLSPRGDDDQHVPPRTPWLFPVMARGAADDGFPSWAPLLSAQLAGLIWATGHALDEWDQQQRTHKWL